MEQLAASVFDTYRQCVYLRSSTPKNAITGTSKPIVLAHQTVRRNISEEFNVHGRFATPLTVQFCTATRQDAYRFLFRSYSHRHIKSLPVWLSSFVSLQMQFFFPGIFCGASDLYKLQYLFTLLLYSTHSTEFMSCIGYVTQ